MPLKRTTEGSISLCGHYDLQLMDDDFEDKWVRWSAKEPSPEDKKFYPLIYLAGTAAVAVVVLLILVQIGTISSSPPKTTVIVVVPTSLPYTPATSLPPQRTVAPATVPHRAAVTPTSITAAPHRATATTTTDPNPPYTYTPATKFIPVTLPKR